ncbi:von Willebrand factor A domain-containing protein 5A-like isoform X4 [Acanthopagrus latus]|uniref:von Willebrand factor A domain-containing protein 5A-like isoform X4 n=1 Tax=Acanthopagrus latus TaxID=8177 RepID=UPI00187BE55A|nr:von Willebrand factor A domain-containing protein 5A-like isoform X4 [Acanthopagrus latus]
MIKTQDTRKSCSDWSRKGGVETGESRRNQYLMISTKMDCCGLLTAQKEPVPLKSVEVELQVRDHVATVVSTLNYENKEDKPVEAVFVFPLPGDAAVCHFSATIGQTQIVAEVKEKQQAREEYDDALSSGQQAFLLEESDQSPDIFSLSVGSLPPGESASIRLEYVTELAVQADDGLRFCLPAVLNPRYQPQGSEGASVQVTSVPASLVPYSLSFSARVSSPRPVSKVESNCSLDPLQYLNTEQTQAMVKLAAGHKFDRDVEVLIYYKDAHQPTAVVEAGQASAKPGSLMGDPVVMLSLYPEFPQTVMSSLASCGEFVFLLDRSGSMDCPMNNSKRDQTRIGSARDTLLLLLKSLPMGCYFNIYSFGSEYEHIFPASVEYSEKTMEEALKKVEKMDADLGGTEILEPLKHIHSQPCIPNQQRQLFVFTDGEVCNTKEVISLVKKNSGSHRCFSFGIGEGASSALINGLAKEGGGHAQFITGADRMQPKVMQSLRFALQPAVEDISVTWDLPKGVSVTVLSPPITAIFQGQRSLVYAQLSGQSSEAAEGCVKVKYSLAGHPSQNQLHFSLTPAQDTGLTVHRLAARTLIRSLEVEERESRREQDEGVKKKVVELSVQSGVSSTFTAFIAVNKGDGETIQGPLVRRNVPTPKIMTCAMSAEECMLRLSALPAMEVNVRHRPTHPGRKMKSVAGIFGIFSKMKKKLLGRPAKMSNPLPQIQCSPIEIDPGTKMACCGLLTANKEPVPLKSVEVELQVRDHVATVVSTLNYENKEDKPVEAVFVFPLPGDAAVCHFSATIGQTQIVAEVKEKQQAREEYDDALSSGQQAFLLEESDQSPDIFSLSVGSLPPGESASIRLEYVTELAVQADDGLRFCLPAVLNPRYQPQGSEGASVQVTSVPASLVPYSLSFSARVSSPRPVSKVESNCSLDPLQYLNTEQTQATVKLAAGHKFDRDVEVLIYYKDAHQPTAVVEAGQASAKPGSLMGDPVVMLSLYPEFPQTVMSSLASCGEFVFLLDRSGSMDFPMNRRKRDQTRIGSARDTLLLLLKSLPMGCYFNIYSFGTRYEHIFPMSVKYSQKTMEEALKKVEGMGADLGGTEILKALQHIHSQPCIPNQPRQVFVFTDGEVGNTKDVISLVKKNSGSHRCFSFGIGEGASSALINGLAKEGGGHAQFITGADRMQPKVMQSLRFALQPSVVDISVTWDFPKGISVTVLSPPITALFHGQRSLVYAQLSGQSSAAAEGCVKVKYSLAGHPSQNQLHFSLTPAQDTGLTVHRLAARTLIRSLEMEERESRREQDEGVKKKVVELSVQSGVSSTFTAFIAVNKGDGEAIQGPLVRRNVPTPGWAGYHHLHAGFSMMQGLSINSLASYSSLTMMAKPSCGASPDGGATSRMGRERRVLTSRESCSLEQPPRDSLLQLVSLQKASGCWELDPALAAALGKTSEEVENKKPSSVNQEVWATILALIWLHGFKMDAQEEWKLLAMKAASWLRAQNAPCVTECVEAGNALLGCNVQKDALGL